MEKRQFHSVRKLSKTHTKPIRASEKPIRKQKTGNERLHKRNSGIRCAATGSGVKTKQETAGKNKMGRIGSFDPGYAIEKPLHIIGGKILNGQTIKGGNQIKGKLPFTK